MRPVCGLLEDVQEIVASASEPFTEAEMIEKEVIKYLVLIRICESSQKHSPALNKVTFFLLLRVLTVQL